jgi:hypothetical protein
MPQFFFCFYYFSEVFAQGYPWTSLIAATCASLIPEIISEYHHTWLVC